MDYFYDQAAHRFINARGHPLAWSTVRNNYRRILDVARTDVARLAQQLRAGEITLAEWQRAMAHQVKLVHVASAVARGGQLQMSQGDWGFVGGRIKDQYAYLRNFANQIASGEQAVNGVISLRADMYVDAGRSTQEALRRRMMGETGYVDERRHLGVAEHCGDCVEYADRGWQPIDSLPEIGDSQCMVRCQCFFQYRLPDGQEGE